jgi:hypothetical protein
MDKTHVIKNITLTHKTFQPLLTISIGWMSISGASVGRNGDLNNLFLSHIKDPLDFL